MGTIINHTIVISYWKKEDVEEAHKKAFEIFRKNLVSDPHSLSRIECLISPILSGLVNDQYSFFIAPDGSKEGWDTSDYCDVARKEFLDWLQNSHDNFCEYVEVVFGGDMKTAHISRDKDSDLNKEEIYS